MQSWHQICVSIRSVTIYAFSPSFVSFFLEAPGARWSIALPRQVRKEQFAPTQGPTGNEEENPSRNLVISNHFNAIRARALQPGVLPEISAQAPMSIGIVEEPGDQDKFRVSRVNAKGDYFSAIRLSETNSSFGVVGRRSNSVIYDDRTLDARVMPRACQGIRPKFNYVGVLVVV